MKPFKLIIFSFTLLFMYTLKVNAQLVLNTDLDCSIKNNGHVCEIKLLNTENLETNEIVSFNISKINEIENNTISINTQNSWELLNESKTINISEKTILSFRYISKNSTKDDISIGTINYSSSNDTKSIAIASDISCEKLTFDENIIYYDNTYKIVNEDEYYHSCFICQNREFSKDNKDHCSDGKPCSHEEYLADCLTCVITSDEKYHCRNGNECLENEYYKECFPHSCEKDENNFYNYDGNKVTEDEYRKDCFSCFVDENNKYYDANGIETDYKTYSSQCANSNVCTIEGNNFYCRRGNLCTRQDFENECPENAKTGSNIPILIFTVLPITVIIIAVFGKRSVIKNV